MSSPTVTVPVSGPSTVLAMLRAVHLKAARIARTAWTQAVLTLSLVTTTPATVTSTITTVVSTAQGYNLAAETIRAVVTATWNGLTRAARFLVRLLRCALDAVTVAVGYVSATAVDAVHRGVCAVVDTVEVGFTRLDEAVRQFGRALWTHSGAVLVRTAATTAAGASSAFTALNTLTNGAAARLLLTWLPAWLRRRVLLAGGWPGPILVATVTIIALICEALRGWFRRRRTRNATAADTSAPTTGEGSPDAPKKPMETPATPPARRAPSVEEELDALDWAKIADGIRVEITGNGSVIVHGIAQEVPTHLRDRVASIAADAAIVQLRRTLRQRHHPSRDDRRLFTKVAREALRAQARRRGKTGAAA